MEHVNRIGLEVEGGWWTDSQLRGELKHDGSVRFKQTNFKVRGNPGKTRGIQLGEMSSPPLPTLEDGVKWIEKYWPDKRNETCGFHIHFSFKDTLKYAYLMDKEFYTSFLAGAHEFGAKERMSREYFDRLEGKNRYCKKMFDENNVFIPENQVEFQHNHQYSENNPRYAHLNFCFRTHGTVENRLPTGNMTPGKAIKTLEWYLNFVEKYLSGKVNEQSLVFEVGQVEQKHETISLTTI